jgi:hypothetical protein
MGGKSVKKVFKKISRFFILIDEDTIKINGIAFFYAYFAFQLIFKIGIIVRLFFKDLAFYYLLIFSFCVIFEIALFLFLKIGDYPRQYKRYKDWKKCQK